MKPSEALRRDWGLYFDSTWMLVDGVVQFVRLIGQDLHASQEHDQEGGLLDPEAPEVWFPRAGAYNSAGRAVYIGRRARRCMKKSASYDHYYNQWGRAIQGGGMLWTMAKGRNLLPWNAAKLIMDSDGMTSCAVGPHLIMQLNRDGYGVVYRGLEIGVLKGHTVWPIVDNHPLNERAISAMNERNIQCHLSN